MSLDYTAPLWRSEGEDRLFRFHDATGALDAFEKALSVIERSAFLYGVAAEHRMLYGAAASAALLSDRDRARRYRDRYKDAIQVFRANPQLGEYSRQCEEGLNWHNRSI